MDSQRRSRRNQHFNSRSCKLRGVLELSPSGWSLEEVLMRKEPYLYRHLGYRRFGKEESRVFDSRTHELRVVKSACAKARVVVVW
jgi:hypothetical protein